MTHINPAIPAEIRQEIKNDKERAYTLYLDFVVDGTASMSSLFPAVYYAAEHILEGLSRYDVYPMNGITVIRNEEAGEHCDSIRFEDGELFTRETMTFLKKLRGLELFGGGNDGRESVHTAIGKALKKFPTEGRNRALIIFTDAYGSNDYEDFREEPLGKVVFFGTEEIMDEDFRFCFISPEGNLDDSDSPMYVNIEKLLKPMSTELLENIVKPVKDLMKGVSIGA